MLAWGMFGSKARETIKTLHSPSPKAVIYIPPQRHPKRTPPPLRLCHDVPAIHPAKSTPLCGVRQMRGQDHLWLPLADIFIGWTARAISTEYLLTEAVSEWFSRSRGADRLRHSYARDPYLVRRMDCERRPPTARRKTPSVAGALLRMCALPGP